MTLGTKQDTKTICSLVDVVVHACIHDIHAQFQQGKKPLRKHYVLTQCSAGWNTLRRRKNYILDMHKNIGSSSAEPDGFDVSIFVLTS